MQLVHGFAAALPTPRCHPIAISGSNEASQRRSGPGWRLLIPLSGREFFFSDQNLWHQIKGDAMRIAHEKEIFGTSLPNVPFLKSREEFAEASNGINRNGTLGTSIQGGRCRCDLTERHGNRTRLKHQQHRRQAGIGFDFQQKSALGVSYLPTHSQKQGFCRGRASFPELQASDTICPLQWTAAYGSSKQHPSSAQDK